MNPIRTKIFWDDDPEQVETEVNDWLKSMGDTIIVEKMIQSRWSDSGLALTVSYSLREEGF